MKATEFAISTEAQETPKNTCKEAFDVLVVDDSAVARKLVEHALPKEEFRVIPAKTGLEALDLFAACRPGLVITDWLMPDLIAPAIPVFPNRLCLVRNIRQDNIEVAGLLVGHFYAATELFTTTAVGDNRH